jgi:S-adenosylmethionine synthetase
VEDGRLEEAVRRVFALKPGDIIRDLKLLRPIYEATSAYGHFGRTTEFDTFTWEALDKVNALLASV